MTTFRWLLAVACLGIWAMAAWGNFDIAFRRKFRNESGGYMSLAMFIGGVFAALSIWAMPLQGGPRFHWICLGAWVLMALLDVGSLGYLLLIAWAALTGGFKDEGKP